MSAPESISPLLALHGASERLDAEMLSAGALVVLWAAAADERALVDGFLRQKGPGWCELMDRRRKLTQEQQDRLEMVDAYAAEASEFYKRVKDEEWQPVLRDVLIRYCTAFEHFLKSVALTLRVCDGDLDRQVFPRTHEIERKRAAVRTEWDNSRSSGLASFFERSVLAYWPTSIEDALRSRDVRTSLAHCPSMDAAFGIRNALVHNGGKIRMNLELGSFRFQVGDDAVLELPLLSATKRAMQELAYPMSRLWIL